jgi:hypothetical protein
MKSIMKSIKKAVAKRSSESLQLILLALLQLHPQRLNRKLDLTLAHILMAHFPNHRSVLGLIRVRRQIIKHTCTQS